MMESLYPKILGAQWEKLHPTVQHLHSFQDGVFSAHGQFNIRHGQNILARLMAWVLRMPKASEVEEVSLTVKENNSSEKWVRTIGGREFPSLQLAHGPEILSERLGLIEIHFNLKTDQGCLLYLQKSVSLRLLGTSIPLPTWMSPKIRAFECPVQEVSCCKINVEINFPLLGTLLKYSGLLQRDSS